MIWEELEEALILTDVEANTYEDVMDTVGQAFVDIGYCKESYPQALKDREAEYPTGLDIDGVGVAIPHTDISHVNKSATAIAILKNPVTFVQMGTDDETTEVRIVFMLGVKDPHAHLDKLTRILAILQDKEVLEKLLECKDKAEIIDTIKEKELVLEAA